MINIVPTARHFHTLLMREVARFLWVIHLCGFHDSIACFCATHTINFITTRNVANLGEQRFTIMWIGFGSTSYTVRRHERHATREKVRATSAISLRKPLSFFSTAKGHVCFISVKCKNVKYVLLQEYSCNTTVLYKLSYTNRRARLNCDNCFNPGKTEPILLLFSGQSLFPYINFLNNVFLFLTHEALLHGVWCAMSVIRSIGRCFVRR